MPYFYPIILLLFLTIPSHATRVFQQNYTLWAPTEVLIYPQNLQIADFSPGSLCFELASQNKTLRGSACRIAGALQRDTIAATYFDWLAQNLHPRSTPLSLAARDPAVHKYLQLLDDRYLLYLYQSGDTTWLALFAGPRAQLQPENPYAPVAVHFQLQVPSAAALNQLIHQLWFKQKSQPRLSLHEKQMADNAPDALYTVGTELDTWVGVAYGRTSAHIPLTPESWTDRKRSSRIANYRVVEDSTSSWNILDDRSLLWSLRGGFTWRDFVGAELFVLYSQHPVKYLERDPIYQELKNWSFDRYEIGLTAHFNYNYSLGPRLLWQPQAFMGFHYSFLHEKIALNPGFSGSDAYVRRLKFMPFYKGTIFGASQRLIWNRKIAIETRTGINNRSRSQEQNPSMNEVDEPTIIGASTLDWFATMAVEYHWTWDKL